MSKFRKKAIVVEAELFDRDKKHHMSDEFRAHLEYEDDVHDRFGIGYYVNTIEGRMQIHDGDYLIKGVEGEFYPCKASIFKATYEPVV